MTTAQIKERLEGAKAKLTKKEGTLARHSKTLSKKEAELVARGFEATATMRDCYEAGDRESARIAMDANTARDSIRDNERDIESLREMIEKYSEALKVAEADESDESEIMSALPGVLSTMSSELVKTWDAWDTERRAYLKELYAKDESLAHKVYMRLHGHEDELRTKTDEAIHKDNVRAARVMIIDLVRRVRDITGTITEWERLECVNGAYGAVLNGVVNGEKGAAKVETIGAGGWNIVRFHYRTLVKPCRW